MTLRDRISKGTPLRLGEFAKLVGYSRKHVWKLVVSEVIETVVMPGGKERRIPPSEAERIARDLRLL